MKQPHFGVFYDDFKSFSKSSLPICLTIESPTMVTLFHLDIEWEFELFVIRSCSNLFAEFVLFLFYFFLYSVLFISNAQLESDQ